MIHDNEVLIYWSAKRVKDHINRAYMTYDQAQQFIDNKRTKLMRDMEKAMAIREMTLAHILRMELINYSINFDM